MASKRSTFTHIEITFMRQLRVGRFATADEYGNPTAVPVCYAFDDTYFYIVLDEKPKNVPATQLKRVHNIQVRPEVSLLMDQYDDDWSQLGFVLVHGRAILIDKSHENHFRALQLLRERYIQYQTMALEHATMIMITPDHIVSWGNAFDAPLI